MDSEMFPKEELAMTILTNAFSVNMLPRLNKISSIVQFEEIPLHEVKQFLYEEGFLSAIGHADTAALLTDMLEVPVPVNRINVGDQRWDMIIIAQYVGPRLPEGTTKLPADAKITFIKVSRPNGALHTCYSDCVNEAW